MNKKIFSTQMITEAAIMIALAYILKLFTIFRMPQGGDISLSMLPILIFSIRWGALPGFIVGAVYGVVTLLINPFILHPLQVLLDYPLPSAFVGLAGISTSKDKDNIFGYIPFILLGYALKFLMHYLSGVIFFAEYAGEMNPLLYSFIYNITYLGPEVIIFIIVLFILWNPLKSVLRRQY